MDSVNSFHSIYLYFLIGTVFVSVGYLLNRAISKSKLNDAKLEPYECGEESTSNLHLSINPKFMLIAIAFVLFELELIFVFPWIQTLALGASTSWLVITGIEMLIFIGVLYLGVVHLIQHKDFDWLFSEPKKHTIQSKYQAFNTQSYSIKAFSLPVTEEVQETKSPLPENTPKPAPKLVFKPKIGPKNG
jgi:NADH-quinone oxidoreductase subunit A